eukprot:TRINITY_DN11099_c0_g1_i3.p1 TRINITY_DN11099_c0_g1~~TRINITY_DN11099_c0_g1_i3.p1  ORF type:complete len:258 (+),score=46.71 TRINITY_DN11099_c0_g1_i3:60-833(+)
MEPENEPAVPEEEEEPQGPRTLCLVGVTGDGKSSTGNSLCGRQEFVVSGGLSSETSEVAHADYLHMAPPNFFEYRCIDTIGLQDTGLPAGEVIERFNKFSEHCAYGIDVFLFVVRWGRFKPEHEAAFDAFVANCGEAALGHTVLVFTHCKLSADELCAQVEAHAPKALQRLLPALAGPPVGIENVELPTESKAALQQAIDAACEANNSKRYSNEALAAARSQADVKREEERIAFAAAVSDWRKTDGPVEIVREFEQK